MVLLFLYGGTDQIRTGAQGVADPRLTTWLRFHNTIYASSSIIIVLYFFYTVNLITNA